MAGNSDACLGFQAKWPMCLPHFSQVLGVSVQIFRKVPGLTYHIKLRSGSGVDTCGQTDMTEIMGAFRVYANAPNIN